MSHHRILLVLWALLASATVWGQPAPYVFDEEIPWFSQVGPVIRVMEGLGYTAENTFLDADNALVFSAEDELVYFYFNGDDELLSVALYVLTSDITAESPPEVQFSATVAAYEEMKGALSGLYGEPSYDVVTFEAPYAQGDGREIEAVRAEKATYSAGWQNQGQEGGVFLYLDRDADVAVSWEAPEWSAYLDSF